MSMNVEQVYEYAKEIVHELGKSDSERDAVYGGTITFGYCYEGYGLYIYDSFSSILIRYDGETVFSCRLENEYCVKVFRVGRWLEIISALFLKLPKIRDEKRKEYAEQERQRERAKMVRNGCLRYLNFSYKTTISPGNAGVVTGTYGDKNVLVITKQYGGTYSGSGIRLKIYEKGYYEDKHWYGVKTKRKDKLVFDDSQGIFVDGSWCDHILQVIEANKNKEKIEEATKWANRPTVDDYLNNIHEL